MENLILFLKGILIGVANIIPGVSGGTLMITLGLYEKIIEVVSHFRRNMKKNICFLMPIVLGIVVAVLLFSKIISFCLDNYPFPTTFFFIGLVLGGIPLLWNKSKASKKKISNWVVFLITASIVLIFTFLNGENANVIIENVSISNMIMLFLIGIVAAMTMVIPGVSGSFVLMMLGYYELIVNTLRDLTNFSLLGHNLLILVPFGIGVLVGIIGVVKLIEYLLNKYPIKTYYGVLGFVVASLVAIVRPILVVSPSIIELALSCVLVLFGGIMAYKLGDK